MNIIYCFTGSFCTFSKSLEQVKKLVDEGNNVLPVMSFNAYNTNTRFGTAEYFRNKLFEITHNDIIHTIEDAEPIGPKNMGDILVIAPCTSNTIAKLCYGVNDTPVTMAVKSHLRNNKPVVIGVSTNDALGCTAKNIGYLMNMNNYYIVPMAMDSPVYKPKSLVCKFEKIADTIDLALSSTQIQIF